MLFRHHSCHLFQKGQADRGHRAKLTRLCKVQGRIRYLFALNTLQGILFLIAGHTEILLILGDKALGSNWLLTVMADEASLMPAAALVLHLSGPCSESQEKQSGCENDCLGV